MAKRDNVRDSVLGGPGDGQAPAPWEGQLTGESTTDGGTIETVDAEIMPTSNQIVQGMISWIQNRLDVGQGDSAKAQERIVAEILQAEGPDDVLSPKEATHARDILGVLIYVDSVTYVESDVESDDGCPFYAVFHGNRGDTKQPDVVTCGGWSVVAQAVRLDQLGAWPQLIRFANARKVAKNGKMPLRIERPI